MWAALLRTPACAPARHAAVAGSATYHQRTADVAGGRISHLDKFSERSNRIRAIGINRWLNGHRKGFEQFALVTSQEPEFEPTRDVVHKRLGVADLWISRPTAGLKAHVAEFVAKHAQWHAVLQSKRDHSCEGIHQPGDGRALLRHGDEDLSWQPVLVNSDREISLLPGDGEVMGKRPPFVRQMPTNCGDDSNPALSLCSGNVLMTPRSRSPRTSLSSIGVIRSCRCHNQPHFPQSWAGTALVRQAPLNLRLKA